jgi:methionyl-tRNA formyltransferase
MPRHGCVNVHASLLPKYRGASPIHSAILNGDDETGITIMQMDAGMDTGDIILQKPLCISPSETFSSLHDRMSTLGAEALLEALEQIENNTAIRTPQNNSLATHSPLIKKSDGEINFSHTTKKILNQIRALNCFTTYEGEPLKIFRAEKLTGQGTVSLAGVGAEPQGLIFKTSDGAILVTEVQSPGKEEFLRGRKKQLQTP